jgi:Probable Zinc-ribbon domain
MGRRHGEPLNAKLRREWAEDLNGPLAQVKVTAGSGRRVWWRCLEVGHLWQAAVYSRAHNGCPGCSPRTFTPERSLASARPELASEWDPDANGDLTPDQIHVGAARRVFWACEAGPDHRWSASPDARTRGGAGCPFCANRSISVTNRLDLRYPDLAAEWHPELNDGLTPDRVVYGAARKVWWQCSTDPSHRPWPATVVQRSRLLTRCPTCAGLLASPTLNLITAFPAIAAQWHPTRNNGVSPRDIRPKSNKRYWWKCPVAADHEWEDAVDARTQTGGLGCPFCSGHRTAPQDSIAVQWPELAAQWDWDANGDLTPDQVRPGSSLPVRWTCAEGEDHRWRIAPSVRLAGNGCPYCAGQLPSASYNLAVCAPEVAAEWHPIRNGNLTPYDVTPGSKRSVWWRCCNDSTHEWPADIKNRTAGRGCPTCAEYGFNHGATAVIYLVVSEEHSAIKVGVANRADGRLAQHARQGRVAVHHHDRFCPLRSV